MAAALLGRGNNGCSNDAKQENKNQVMQLDRHGSLDVSLLVFFKRGQIPSMSSNAPLIANGRIAGVSIAPMAYGCTTVTVFRVALDQKRSYKTQNAVFRVEGSAELTATVHGQKRYTASRPADGKPM